jgi:voltage-gated potassium channel
MEQAPHPSEANNISNWQILILFLSVYVISALTIDTLVKLPSDVSYILRTVDTVVCFIFLGDFFWRLASAQNKAAYMKWGWIDLISSIPTLDALRWARAVRVVRILRVLRGVKSAKILIEHLFRNRAKGAFFSVAMISFVLIVFSSIAILQVEPALSGSNIKNGADALWWAFVTITTVGYGDYYPVSTTGRIIAAVLMTAGVGLFGTFTAYVANLFLEQPEAETAIYLDPIMQIEKLGALRHQGHITDTEFDGAKQVLLKRIMEQSQ